MADQVIRGLYDGVTSRELVQLLSETAANMTIEHSDYSILAARIVVKSLHKETESKFSGMLQM